jgi:ribosomal protein S18 acetylase RimI-like enzyme
MTRSMGYPIRPLAPSDYSLVISVVNAWWGGRNMADMIPKLFFIHFQQTSFAVEHQGELIGFLIGFVSQTFRDEAYIHFVGVHPDFRQHHIGQNLYEAFFQTVKMLGCVRVRCVTSPINKGSIAFHQKMGFVIEPSEKSVDGVCMAENYDGHGGDRVLFCKHF